MYSVPFSIDEYEGFLQTRSIVRIEEEAVVLEFKKTGGCTWYSSIRYNGKTHSNQ